MSMCPHETRQEEYPAISKARNDISQILYNDVLKITGSPEATHKILLYMCEQLNAVFISGKDTQRHIFTGAIEIARRATLSPKAT